MGVHHQLVELVTPVGVTRWWSGQVGGGVSGTGPGGSVRLVVLVSGTGGG